MTLSEAINAVENALTAADNTELAKVTAQAKYDAAQVALEGAKTADLESDVAFDAALDTLIAAAQASKRSVPAV